MRWLLVNADNTLDGIEPLATKPTLGVGQRAEEVAAGYPDTVEWSPARGGFVDLAVAAPLISVGSFKLLFTESERLALLAAAKIDPRVEDFRDLLSGFTNGVSLTHPVMIAAIGQLEAGGLLTAPRAAAILAGEQAS